MFIGLATQAPMALGDDYPIALKEVVVPREEMRQQILTGIKEYRYAFSFANVPDETTFIAECYTDGKFTRRFQLTSAMAWKNSGYGHGTLSLGWNCSTRELALIVDNGFGLWNSRLIIPSEDFDRPDVIVSAEKPISETRETPDYYPPHNTIYPILGLVGSQTSEQDIPIVKGAKVPSFRIRGKTHFSLTSATDFVHQVTAYGTRHCLIIYAFSNVGGGNSPFHVENGNYFHGSDLPMN
jgi:hypothetical protein